MVVCELACCVCVTGRVAKFVVADYCSDEVGRFKNIVLRNWK